MQVPTSTAALASSSTGATSNPARNGNLEPKSKPERSYQLFVTGLNEQVRKDDLRAHLEAFGSLAVFNVKFESRRRGYAFVSFADPACADKALAAGAQQTVSDVPLVVKRFVEKLK
jgi:RNA recognition motif-containing protein